MNTPSKEALEAACDLFKHRYCYGSDNDNAAIIDRHFSPLRQRAEQAEARVKEYEAQLSAVMPADFKDWHQNSRSEWPVVTALVIRNLQACMKELEACLVASRADCDRRDEWLDQDRSELAALRAANAELQKQEAESRRLFYAEQDKRQSAEYRIGELEAALRKIAAQKPEKPDYWTPCGQCDSNIEDAKDALARREVQP